MATSSVQINCRVWVIVMGSREKRLTKGSNESIKWVTHSRNQGKDIKVKEEDSKMS